MIFWKKLVVNWFGRGEILQLDGIDLWYESFGEKSNPCLLLIMGGCCQGILWPDLFCEKLTSLGFFVVRFDARDTGYSSYFDYKKNPYTLLDMAKDAVLLLDYLKIEKAHLMGTSMGGAVAQILAVHFPFKLLSLILMATSVDFRNVVNAIQSKELGGLPLPDPSKECLEWIKSFSVNHPHLTCLQKIKKQQEGWKMLNGPKASFDGKYYKKMMIKTVLRQRSYQSFLNHVCAISSSVDILLDTMGKIQVPVLVIQGKEDPVFPKEHGEFLANNLPYGQLFLVEKMGHNLNSCFYDVIIEKINSFLKGK